MEQVSFTTIRFLSRIRSRKPVIAWRLIKKLAEQLLWGLKESVMFNLLKIEELQQAYANGLNSRFC